MNEQLSDEFGTKLKDAHVRLTNTKRAMIKAKSELKFAKGDYDDALLYLQKLVGEEVDPVPRPLFEKADKAKRAEKTQRDKPFVRTNGSLYGITAKDAEQAYFADLNAKDGQPIRIKNALKVHDELYGVSGLIHGTIATGFVEAKLVRLIEREKWSGEIRNRSDLDSIRGWEGIAASYEGKAYVLGGRADELTLFFDSSRASQADQPAEAKGGAKKVRAPKGQPKATVGHDVGVTSNIVEAAGEAIQEHFDKKGDKVEVSVNGKSVRKGRKGKVTELYNAEA